MHERGLVRGIFKYLDEEEAATGRRIKKIYVALSEFGSLTKEHFADHFRAEAHGTPHENTDLAIATVPFGPELEITKIDFV
ncbi:MAG: hydrogenase/urease maturation nickel metallochaperone HypA [Candidatus Omnitrophica bacterium]|nr:hydrogenase/urease maturation nickel metallochaperone HypA [Candidatus Omnitrophota bacterium]